MYISALKDMIDNDFWIHMKFQSGCRGIESYLRRINSRWPAEVKFHLFHLRSTAGLRIECGFDSSALCTALSVGEDPRGSPSSSTSAGSKKSKRAAISHTRKGDFVHFGASLRIMYTAVAHRPTPRPLGIEAIPRLVIACCHSLSCSSSFPFFYPCFLVSSFLSFRVCLKYAGCPRQIAPRWSVNRYCCSHAFLAFSSFVFESNRKAWKFSKRRTRDQRRFIFEIFLVIIIMIEWNVCH